MNELTVIPPGELVRQSTDIAGLCKEIVLKSAMEIQKRKYVKVEGWQSIAVAHGCVASSRDVERIEGGFRAIGEIRRMTDGFVIASAEGFVGEDEPTWFGGETEVWDKELRKRVKKMLPKRPQYAIRAMAQTRAISRACRSAFAHVVVLMDAGLSTTPAEEVPHGGFSEDNAIEERQDRREQEASRPPQSRQNAPESVGSWKDTVCTYGKKGGPLRGKRLGDLNPSNLEYLWKQFEGKEVKDSDRKMVAALAIWASTGKKDDDQIPGLRNDEHIKREELAAMLQWLNPEITKDDFMGAMIDAKQIPADGKWAGMSEETATKFLDDSETMIAIVRAWQAKVEGVAS